MSLTDALAETKPQHTATDKLPAYIKNFVLLQHEIIGLDVGMIRTVSNPDMVAEGEKAKKSMKDTWARHLRESLEFMRKLLSQLSIIVDRNLDYLDQLEQEITEEIERLDGSDPDMEKELAAIKEDIALSKAQARKQKEKLSEMSESDVPLPEDELDDIKQDVQGRTNGIMNLASRFYNRMKGAYKSRFTAQAAAAADATMQSQERNSAAHDFDKFRNFEETFKKANTRSEQDAYDVEESVTEKSATEDSASEDTSAKETPPSPDYN